MLLQKNRMLQLDVPSLGENIFIPIEAYVFEAISQSFYATIECLSNHIELNPEKILGKLANLAFVDHTNQKKRYVNGIIAEFERNTLKQTTFRQYRLTLRPYFWLLNFGEDCQSFTGLSVIEIIKNECKRLGIYEIDLSGLTKNYECLVYKVQFNESHFNFLSRLMEEAGISYYYRHTKKQHTLVLVDETNNFPNSYIEVKALKIGEQQRLPDNTEYISMMHTALDQPALFAWNKQQTFQPLQSCTRPLSDRRLNQQDFLVKVSKGATMTTLLPKKYCVLAFPQVIFPRFHGHHSLKIMRPYPTELGSYIQ